MIWRHACIPVEMQACRGAPDDFLLFYSIAYMLSETRLTLGEMQCIFAVQLQNIPFVATIMAYVQNLTVAGAGML
jgi:hypothetical protein